MVALEHKVLVYDFKDLKLLHSIETLSNPMGLVALSSSQDQIVMACPGLHSGQVNVSHTMLNVSFASAQSKSRLALACTLAKLGHSQHCFPFGTKPTCTACPGLHLVHLDLPNWPMVCSICTSCRCMQGHGLARLAIPQQARLVEPH